MVLFHPPFTSITYLRSDGLKPSPTLLGSRDQMRMLGNAGRSSQLIIVVCFPVFFAFSSSSECPSFRTGTLRKYLYPMKELAADVTSFNVSVKVMKYAYITLSPVSHDTIDQYEIAIGNSEEANTAAIRRCRQCEDRKSVTTPYRLLEFNEFKTFWVKFQSGIIQIGRYNENAFVSWTDLYPLDIRYIGIATGVPLAGDFIFCGIRFKSGEEISLEGLFGLGLFFLLPTLMLIRFLFKKLKRNFKHSDDSNNHVEIESNDSLDTRGIENPAPPIPDPDPPSYEKCMEFPHGRNLLHSADEGASSSCDVQYNSDPPPSYEAAMAHCLLDMNCDAHTQRCGLSSMWDAGSVNEKCDDLETFV